MSTDRLYGLFVTTRAQMRLSQVLLGNAWTIHGLFSYQGEEEEKKKKSKILVSRQV